MRNRDFGLSGMLAVLGAAFSLLFGLAAHTAGPATVAAFGPEKFVQGTGAPQRFTRNFALPPGADGRCTLAVQNGDGDKTRVTGATLTLNGAVAVGPAEFLKPVSRIEKAVALKPQNALTVYLASKPGSFLVVSVACPATGSGNAPPVADAGPDRTVSARSAVQLDGSASRDADGDALSYRWTLTGKPFGSRAALSDSRVAKPTFVADLPGEYVAQLIVNDGKADSAPDTIKIKATATANTPPVADAGPDQTVPVASAVQLDGSASRDADGDALAYGWLLVKRPLGSRAYLQSWLTAKPTLVADKAGEYVAQLVVFDGRAFSAPDQVSIVAGAVANTPPVADAGPDQTSEVGKTARLDGGGSSDADGDPLTYAWTLSAKPAGSAATLSDPAAVDPAFTVDKPGTYKAQLVVGDGKASSAPDEMTVSTLNSAPVADAGPDQTAKVGATVRLDGTGSTDADGDPLTYAWTLPTRPAGSAATLSDPATVDPAFTVDKPGTYQAQLTVNDGAVASAPDGVTVTTENSPPVADAGPDQTATVGATVRLNGTGSTDVDGDALTYQWSLTDVPAGSAATLAEPTAPETTFVADKPGRYVAQLLVHDGKVPGEPDTVTVSTENSRPVSEAGPDQTVALNAVARLNGGGSADPDGDPLTYRWSLTGVPTGSAATLSDPTAVDPTFVADKAGRYAAQLIVNDGALDSEPDTATVSTENSKPVADAGPDRAAEVGKPVTLDGAASRDADGDALTYRWSLVARPDGSAASPSAPDVVAPSFVPDLAGEYVAQLIVNDGALDSEPDTAAVTATDPAPTNRAPTITSTAVIQATAGQPYSYRVVATDPDAGDALTYSLPTKPDGMTVDPATGLIQWTPAAAGGANVVVRVTDRGGLFAEQSFTVTVAAATANRAPEVSAVANPATVTLPTNSVALNGTVTDDGLPDPPAKVTVLWTKDSGPGTVTFGDAGKEDTAATFSAAGTYVLKLTANDGEKSASATVTVTVNPEVLPPLPPDPGTVAPQVDPTVATTTYAATQFLYSGSNPIQTGVAPGTIEPKRAAVLRGRVLDKQNNPLPAVVVTVLNHPEFGQTLSRADGWFDLAVNGGGYLAVNYQKAGYLPAQRQVNAPWQDFVVLDDVVLVGLDSQVTAIDLGSSAPFQVAQGSVMTDASGTRQATLLFPQGTTATMVLPNGSTQPLGTLQVRATEYTVGTNGPQAMPAELPPTSAYTYAVELSVDEAITAGAKTVQFSRPIPFYVDNFLNFPVGIQVPLAYYDREKAAWVPTDDGRVIKVLSIVGGVAQVDTTGDGAADNGVALGMTEAERQRIASLYPAGKTLSRMAVTHFTTYDPNFGIVGASNQGPNGGDTRNNDQGKEDCPAQVQGSIVECENQTLGELIPVVGTGMNLNYRSDRVPGRKAANTLTIPLSGASVPSVLKRIELEVTVSGRVIKQTFPTAPNQTHTFTWDGLDTYGRTLRGTQPVSIRIGYVYDGFYALPPSMARTFGVASGQRIPGDIPARQEVTLWQEQQTTIGPWSNEPQELGGWNLTVHHAYDPLGKVLYQGDGSRRSAKGLNASVISTLAGGGNPTGGLGDGGPATAARLLAPWGVAARADGGVLIGDSGNHRVRLVSSEGIITTYAGTGLQGYSGDGGPATAAQLSSPAGVAVGSDGSVLIADVGNSRVRRVGPDGIITTFAGGGNPADGLGDGGLATAARLQFLDWGVIAIGPDGSVLIVDARHRIRRVAPDGIITTIAGTGVAGYSGDGGPAIAAQLSSPSGVAIGADGGVLIADWRNHRIRRVGPDGIITTIAGTGVAGYSGDGGPAIAAQLNDPHAIPLGAGGSLLIVDWANHRLRRVGPDGIITTIAGAGQAGFSGDGGPATAAQLAFPWQMAVGADGNVLIADRGNSRIRRISASLTGFSFDDISIASEDGRLLYRFNASGRHLSTVDTLTDATLYTFAYDSAGRLASITDGDGNVTTIERDGNGNPTAIVAPFGQRTALTLDGNGYLASVANPAGETYRMTYTGDGLLTWFADPKGNASQFAYDALGRLQRDADPAGGSQNIARTDLADGYTVTRTTALSRITTYGVVDLSTGDRQRRVIAPDGTVTQTLSKADGTTQTTAPDGTVSDLLQGPDPRFGMLAPLPKSLSVTTGGLTSTLTTERTANLSNPQNALSLTSLADTVTLNGRTARNVYTAATRTTTATSPAGRQSTAVSDAQGRITQAQVPGLATVNASYDGRGRPSSLGQSSGGETRALSFAYDPQGYLQTVTDPLGRTVSYERDAAGRVTTQTLPDGRQILYGYDAGGNLTSLTPPGRSAHVFAYTPVDLTQQYTPPAVDAGNPSTVYAYNADKQLTQIGRPDGQMVSFAYDGAGRLSALTTPTGAYDYGYNGAGQLAGIAAPDGGLAYSYSGALLTQTAWTGAVAGAVGFAYDNDFRLISVSVNGGNPVAYQYDPDSLLIQAGDLTLSRDPQNGLLTGTSLGGVGDSLSYNGFGEVANYSAAHNGAAFFATQYTRDALGRITEKRETVQGATDTYAYGYDPAGRLVQVSKNGAIQSSYSYDANGNRLSKTAGGSTVNGAYDAQDRLTQYGGTTYAYTANGELTGKTAGAQTTAYQYDVLGNLRRVTLPGGTAIEYLIDGANRRVGKKVGGALVQGFLYQDGLKPVAELDGNGQIVGRFVYATGVNVPDYMVRGGAIYRIVKDHLGSPRLMVDTSTGNVLQRMDYDEFGNVLNDTNPGFQPFGFAGGLYDRDTRLVRFGARDYDAETGRWTAKDPILFGGGDANLYDYTSTDPVNSNDEEGLASLSFSAFDGVGGGVRVAWTEKGISFSGEVGVGIGAFISFDPLGNLDRSGAFVQGQVKARVPGTPVNITPIKARADECGYSIQGGGSVGIGKLPSSVGGMVGIQGVYGKTPTFMDNASIAMGKDLGIGGLAEISAGITGVISW